LIANHKPGRRNSHLALRLFRENDWVAEIGQGVTTINVVVKQPPVAHKVRVKDFD